MRRLPLCLFPIICLLIGCGPALFVPNSLNTPLFEKKEDFKFGMGMVGKSPRANFDFQGAYAASDHLAVVGNVSLMPNFRNGHYLVEGGAGYFTAFGRDEDGWQLGRFETLAGYGFAWASEMNDPEERSGRYQRLFIQPALGLRTPRFDVVLASRLSAVNFSDYCRRVNGTTVEQSQFAFSMLEPSFTLTLRQRNINLYFQLTNALPLSGTDEYEKTSSAEFVGFLNIGITIDHTEVENPKDKTPPATHFSPIPYPGNGPTDGPVLAPAVVPVLAPEVTLCFMAGDSPPDPELFTLTYNGTRLAKQFRPGDVPQCFSVNVSPQGESVLRIQMEHEGMFRPNTLLISVFSGGEEQWFYLRPEMEMWETVRFRVGE